MAFRPDHLFYTVLMYASYNAVQQGMLFRYNTTCVVCFGCTFLLVHLTGPDDPLIELSRALAQSLTKEHRVALAAHLRMVLELVGT